MNKVFSVAAGRKLSKAAMKQLHGGGTNLNAWVCGGMRVTYYKRSECEKACALPDKCVKFVINPA
jgi:hypothetical protein